jgi:imidazole glycerol-phosphate synthase subunit HisF
MKTKRVIARLDVKGPNLVKGIHLEGLRVLGNPSEFAKYYYEEGADELFLADCVASLYGRNSLKELIKEVASNVFIPITVGGGIRSIDDINDVLRAGADKVSINTIALKNPSFIQEAAKVFGSSTIVVTIEAIKEPDGRYLAYTDSGREFTGVDAVEWAKKAAEYGAGEIVITSVDKEGTGESYDSDLTSRISEVVDIPVIAHGGAGNYHHCKDVFEACDIDGIALASLLHYSSFKRFENSREGNEGNNQFAQTRSSFHNFQNASIPELKRFLQTHKINTRL